MSWAGKIAGTALGWVAGPLGAFVGSLLGHQYDRGWRGGSVHVGGTGARQQALQEVFFRAAFAVMGHIAKADGRVGEESIQAVRGIMYRLQLKRDQVSRAIEHFNRGKNPRFDLQRLLDDLYVKLGDRDDLCRGFVELQMEAMLAASAPSRRQRALLWQVASTLGVNRFELTQLEAMLRARQEFAAASTRRSQAAELAQAYDVLGVEQTVQDREIKAAYRRLMNRHHPDKLVAHGHPESMQELAKDKTREIRAAYDLIRAARGIR